MRWSEQPPRNDTSYPAWTFSLFLLALPAIVLGLLAQRTGSFEIAVGAGVLALFLLVFIRAHPVWRPPVSASIVILYLIALVWAWLPLRGSPDWAPHLAQGVLLLAGVMLLAAHDLTRTGAEPLRRANKWTHRIKSRRYWPEQLGDCRVLPEAAGLRAAIRNDPGPALALLSDERAEVQATALGALEYRPYCARARENSSYSSARSAKSRRYGPRPSTLSPGRTRRNSWREWLDFFATSRSKSGRPPPRP